MSQSPAPKPAKKNIVTRDIRGRLLFLGTGTSMGVPVVGCGCDVCQSTNPKNKRTRCSVIFGLPEGNLLIDTPPDLRTQLLATGIGIIHAVAFTHSHADHLFGLDDIRLFQFYIGHAVPIYCEANVDAKIRKVYDYAFSTEVQTHVGSRPALDMKEIGLNPFEVLGAKVTPIRLQHGPRFQVLGFRVGNVAYCTDVNHIPEESWAKLEGLDVLVLDALRPEPHPTHFSIEEAVEVAQKVGAKKTYFTHIACKLEHERTNAWLPEGMELAYDGLELPLT
ncbi:MBL fold metallo-hydrolase [Bremerella sp. P1]|uniref:MBL fold metallo-hydrolase n=1 Tax=Bremerella sp. P1 TaxID=3026424 RepID=UPI00236858EA|nr:MBL fold metallo-hydrolase [Bremerella sp. P1]WDI43351.1 MBL fold metallo-hydrolase [Bremerella sp. P1]